MPLQTIQVRNNILNSMIRVTVYTHRSEEMKERDIRATENGEKQWMKQTSLSCAFGDSFLLTVEANERISCRRWKTLSRLHTMTNPGRSERLVDAFENRRRVSLSLSLSLSVLAPSPVSSDDYSVTRDSSEKNRWKSDDTRVSRTRRKEKGACVWKTVECINSWAIRGAIVVTSSRDSRALILGTYLSARAFPSLCNECRGLLNILLKRNTTEVVFHFTRLQLCFIFLKFFNVL